MSIKQKINLKYAEYCKQLGDLQFKRHCIDLEIKQLIRKIEKLNELQPELLEALNERKSGDSSQSSRVSINEGGGVGQIKQDNPSNPLQGTDEFYRAND